ncbi:hypothetical protein HELRODRAFT_172348 [Helobdella robusta]|uniref:Protein kinase domain-containing protein n=1 Tax=Helobdella robusta TaxID=6412 RepID=T1F577_HELRO|nr:hypothetical protein HELRODRAFT_172348 [Helobdella robusta]ESO04679.1 hypothetical protein HELRODRAFT_172348 [Helobdella robusta]
MAELSNGRPLFAGESEIDQLYLIQEIIGPLPPAMVKYFFKNHRFDHWNFPSAGKSSSLDANFKNILLPLLLSFLKSVLALDPSMRLTADDCVEHPCFQMERSSNISLTRRRDRRKNQIAQDSVTNDENVNKLANLDSFVLNSVKNSHEPNLESGHNLEKQSEANCKVSESVMVTASTKFLRRNGDRCCQVTKIPILIKGARTDNSKDVDNINEHCKPNIETKLLKELKTKNLLSEKRSCEKVTAASEESSSASDTTNEKKIIINDVSCSINNDSYDNISRNVRNKPNLKLLFKRAYNMNSTPNASNETAVKIANFGLQTDKGSIERASIDKLNKNSNNVNPSLCPSEKIVDLKKDSMEICKGISFPNLVNEKKIEKDEIVRNENEDERDFVSNKDGKRDINKHDNFNRNGLAAGSNNRCSKFDCDSNFIDYVDSFKKFRSKMCQNVVCASASDSMSCNVKRNRVLYLSPIEKWERSDVMKEDEECDKVKGIHLHKSVIASSSLHTCNEVDDNDGDDSGGENVADCGRIVRNYYEEVGIDVEEHKCIWSNMVTDEDGDVCNGDHNFQHHGANNIAGNAGDGVNSGANCSTHEPYQPNCINREQTLTPDIDCVEDDDTFSDLNICQKRLNKEGRPRHSGEGRHLQLLLDGRREESLPVDNEQQSVRFDEDREQQIPPVVLKINLHEIYFNVLVNNLFNHLNELLNKVTLTKKNLRYNSQRTNVIKNKKSFKNIMRHNGNIIPTQNRYANVGKRWENPNFELCL